MKKVKLDPQEQKINKDYNNNKFVSLKHIEKETDELIKLSKNYLKKTKNINIRISQPVLLKLKSKAVNNGMPYQTLISTLLHQYANGKVKLSL
ncbi:hypothetical protein DRH14_00940 [Candidatus Shapirobacteria bacterium]|nr:MAG: hypothetical protein DRH14_00940 [Candidatus Shapirobacteria bacterium]